MKSFYEYLEINRDATIDEIVAAYERRKKYVEPGTKEYLNIEKGYNILSNPNIRNNYDKWLLEKEKDEQPRCWTAARKELFYNAITTIVKESGTTSQFLVRLIPNMFLSTDHYLKYIDLNENHRVASARVITAIVNDLKDNNRNRSKQKELEHIYRFAHQYILNFYGSPDLESGNKIRTFKELIFKHKLLCFIIAIAILISISLPIYIYHNISGFSKESTICEDDSICSDTSFIATPWQVYECDDSYRDYYDSSISNYESEAANSNASTSTNPATQIQHESHSANIEDYQFIGDEITYRNGDLPYASYFGTGSYDKNSLSSLTLINHSKLDAVVLLCAEKVIRHTFVKKGQTVTLKNIPNKLCIVKTMYGNRWDSGKDNGPTFPSGGFVEDVSYCTTEWDDPFDFTPEQHGDEIIFPTYSLTLHTIKNGNVKTSTIQKNNFFKGCLTD